MSLERRVTKPVHSSSHIIFWKIDVIIFVRIGVKFTLTKMGQITVNENWIRSHKKFVPIYYINMISRKKKHNPISFKMKSEDNNNMPWKSGENNNLLGLFIRRRGLVEDGNSGLSEEAKEWSEVDLVSGGGQNNQIIGSSCFF